MKNFLTKIEYILKGDNCNKKGKDCHTNPYLNKKLSVNKIINISLIILYVIKFISITIINIILNYIIHKKKCQIVKQRKLQVKEISKIKFSKRIFNVLERFIRFVKLHSWIVNIVCFTSIAALLVYMKGVNLMIDYVSMMFNMGFICLALFIILVVENKKESYKKCFVGVFIFYLILISLCGWAIHTKNENANKEKIKITQQYTSQVLMRYSDYYMDSANSSYDKIKEETLNWGSHLFVITKNDDNKTIRFDLIDNSTQEVIETKERTY